MADAQRSDRQIGGDRGAGCGQQPVDTHLATGKSGRARPERPLCEGIDAQQPHDLAGLIDHSDLGVDHRRGLAPAGEDRGA